MHFFKNQGNILFSKGRPVFLSFLSEKKFKFLVDVVFFQPKNLKNHTHTKWCIGVKMLRPACLLNLGSFLPKLVTSPQAAKLVGVCESTPGTLQYTWCRWIDMGDLGRMEVPRLGVRFFPPGCGLRSIDMTFLGEFGDPKLSHFSHDCILGICDLHHASSKKGGSFLYQSCWWVSFVS